MTSRDTPNTLTYADAGVDIDAGNELVRRIKPHVRATRRPGADGEILPPPDGQVQVSLREDEGGFRITVTDQGPGVPPTERDAIFEPFHRVTSHVDGKGLGLAIVRDVAQRHGGRVWVEDGPGAGARFCLWLPASPGRGSQPS